LKKCAQIWYYYIDFLYADVNIAGQEDLLMKILLNIIFILAVSVFFYKCGGGSTGNKDSGIKDIKDIDAKALDQTDMEMTDDQLSDIFYEEIQEEPVEETGEAEIIEGGFMWPCKQNGECLSQICYPYAKSPTGSICTIKCYETCPGEFECKVTKFGGEDMFICVPPVETLCKKCEHDEECIIGGGYCIEYKDGKFCSNDCVQYGECPPGFECKEFEKGEYKGKQCLPKSGSCICAEGTDYTKDVNNCGFCTNKCVYLHGVPSCLQGKCKMIGCEEGYVNLDIKEETGCEYECTYKGEEDPPDPLAVDDNCDGIDGVVSKGVFVSKDGYDDGNNLGTMDFPFLTINSAIKFAAEQKPVKEVYVSTGLYLEQVTVINEISLYGGYDSAAGWKRNIDEFDTVIKWDKSDNNGNIRALIASEINKTTFVDGFTIESGSNNMPGGSSYGVHISKSTDALAISDCKIKSGDGGKGESGKDGETGKPGDNGENGNNSCEHDKCFLTPCETCSKPAYGKGGKGYCSNSGGNGGAPGDVGESGASGSAGENSGGAGGSGGGSGNNGTAGQPGKSGDDGITGKGGDSVGSVNPYGFWQPSNGEEGKDGISGKGGGGGGGGGGEDDYCNIFSDWCKTYGGSGGGGGGGGCNGTGGKGGSGGGGSFGVFLYQSFSKIINNKITYNNGGIGGNGGIGKDGGSGGTGGIGGKHNTSDDEGGGAAGGSGGKGGNGGHGGGGAGGVAFGIYFTEGSLPTCSGNKIQKIGTGGIGGIGGGNPHNVTDGKAGSYGAINALLAQCKE
jgi:hypothetical protein